MLNIILHLAPQLTMPFVTHKSSRLFISMYVRRRYRHRSNTPMYYTRNPVKVLTPYTNSDPLQIETKDLPIAAQYLKNNGYFVIPPGTLNLFKINGYSISVTSEIPSKPDDSIVWEQGQSTTISIPNSSVLITFLASNDEGTFAFFVNRSSAPIEHYISKNTVYTIYTPPSYGNLFINMYSNGKFIFRTYENLQNTTGTLSQLSSLVYSLDFFSFDFN